MSETPPQRAVHIVVKGRVQGVGFRYFVQHRARELGLDGWVRNTERGDVEVSARGDAGAVEQLLATLRRGPQLAWVERVDVEEIPYTGELVGFRVRSTAW